MNLFRIHIRPSGGNTDMATTFQYCLDNHLLGVGWRVPALANTRDWRLYEQAAQQEHDSIQQPRYIYQNVRPNDLVWTRDPRGQYYIGRVVDGWEYWTNQVGRTLDIDIANIFRCEFNQVELDAVPGTVVSGFGNRGRAIQRIDSDSALAYSQDLWNRFARQQVYEVDIANFPDIFAMLDPEETEDLVFLYLQRQGWFVVPNSRKGNTLRFEFMLAHPETYEKAVTQVKTGQSPLNFEDYANDARHMRIFLFQSNGQYDGRCTERVESISRDELESFLRDQIGLFPRSFQTKVSLLDGGCETIDRSSLAPGGNPSRQES